MIERRKTNVCCLSGEQYERTLSTEACICAEEDFEWYPNNNKEAFNTCYGIFSDWGYKRDGYGSRRCVFDADFTGNNRTDQSCLTG